MLNSEFWIQGRKHFCLKYQYSNLSPVMLASKQNIKCHLLVVQHVYRHERRISLGFHLVTFEQQVKNDCLLTICSPVFQVALSQLWGIGSWRITPSFGGLVGCLLILISVCCTIYIGPEKEMEWKIEHFCLLEGMLTSFESLNFNLVFLFIIIFVIFASVLSGCVVSIFFSCPLIDLTCNYNYASAYDRVGAYPKAMFVRRDGWGKVK